MQLLQRPEDPEYLAWQWQHGNSPDTLTTSLVEGCIQSLNRDFQGNIWVSTGLAHMMHKSGGVYIGNRLQWKNFTAVYPAIIPDSLLHSLAARKWVGGHNWLGELCSFRQLTLDEYGIPYLITTSPQYVYAYKEGFWHKVLPTWLAKESDISDIVVQNNCIYLATTNTGVLVWNIQNQNVTQFLVPES